MSTAPGGTGPGADADLVQLDRFQRQFQTEPLGYVDSLDGLRGYSMVVVMFYHARFTIFPGGFLAVSIFFTLSGFLITSLLLREWAADRVIDMRAFWSRRFRRLLPAAWTTLAGVLVLGAFGAWDGDQLRSLRGDIPFSLLQVVNWHFIFEQRTYGAGFTAPTPVEHYWSLAVEEQFYLFLPLTILILLGFRAKRATLRQRLPVIAGVLAVVITLSAVLNGVLARSVSIDRAYFGTDTRMAEMLAGALLACVTVRRLRFPDGPLRTLWRAVGLAGLLGTLALWRFASLRALWMYPWGLLLTSVVTSAVIIGSLQGGLAARVLSFGPAARLGRMSYGTYLVHWPVFLVLTPARTGISPGPLFILRFIISVSISTLLFTFIEEPVRRRHKLRGPRFVIAGATLLPVLLLGTFLISRDAQPSSVIQRDPSGSASEVNDPPRTRRVLFVGDQVASVIAGQMDPSPIDTTDDRKTPAKLRIQASASAVADCGLVSGGWVVLPDGTAERDVARCAGALDTWTSQIAAERPNLVVVIPSVRDAALRRVDSASPWESPPPPTGSDFWSVEIGTSLDSIVAAADSVKAGVVVASGPMAQHGPPITLPAREPASDPETEAFAIAEEAIVQSSIPDPANVPSAAERLSALNVTASAVAASRGLEFVDLVGELVRIGGSGQTLDTGPKATVLERSDRLGLTRWLAGVVENFAGKPAPPVPVPENLRDITPPPAPQVTPRLKVGPGDGISILVVGDSLAYGLGFGLRDWAEGRGTTVTVGARFGCPVARGGRYRFQRDSAAFDPSCDWGPAFPELLQSHRPEVVMLSSSVWQVVDRQLPGDSRYRHLGDPLMDQFVKAEFLSAVDVLASTGATVVLVTAPHIDSGREKGYSGLAESEPARIDRMNEIIREVVQSRPGVTRLIDLQQWLAGQNGREMDPVRRPDGIHFTDEESLSIAEWLGPQLEDIARGG